MMKLEKIKILNDAIDTLKSEFVGLDNIIDELRLAITPWWVTPEIITRPVVVSLWGMTGTGKSSVVRRLLDLLDLKEKALIFDCGQENNDSGTDISGKVSEYLSLENKDNSCDSDSRNMVFVFDEFQYARTLSESGEELNKPALRPIWNIIDDGILRVSEYSYEVGQFLSYFEDLKAYSRTRPGIKLKNLIIEDPQEVKDILEALGYFYFKRSVPGLMESSCSSYNFDDDLDYEGPVEEGKEKKPSQDPYRPLKVLEDKTLRLIIRKTNLYEYKPGNEIIREALRIETLEELVEWLEGKKSKIMSTRKIDCSGSLVFIIGNLDEAFHVEGDLSPDLEADIFYDETSKVSISDIKNALKQRFRAEQISRFGNNIIKYPTLKKIHFQEIIQREVRRICNEFGNSSGIVLDCSPDFLDLLYSEGVYPVQGVRPVFTTIGTIFTPLLSDILIHKASDETIEHATIDVLDPESGYKTPHKEIEITYGPEIKPDRRKLKLTLGELRCPAVRKTRFISAVHETGHAIVMSFLTGVIPTSIVAVSTDRGGFCTTYDPNKTGEIDSRADVRNDVMISLGGYCAEELVYGKDNPDRVLLGSGSDIESAWESLSEAVYKLGYFDPYMFVSRESETTATGVPGGLDDKATVDQKIKTELDLLKHGTTEILMNNLDLLKEFALELGEKGSLSGDRFLDYIYERSQYNTLNSDRLDIARAECSCDWYEEKLRGL